MSLALRTFYFVTKITFLILLLVFLPEIKDSIFGFYSMTTLNEMNLKIHSKLSKIFQSLQGNLSLKEQKYEELRKILSTLDLHRNFASESSGARIVLKSKGIKNPNALLGKNKYNTGMLFDCNLIAKQSNIFFIIDHTEDFYLEEILIISKSVYTNAIKDFVIYSSLDLTSNKWVELGKFRNSKNSFFSHFSIKDIVLTRYIKFEIVSVYNDFPEYYCSMSEIRVYGKTITSFTQKRNQIFLQSNKELDVFSKKNTFSEAKSSKGQNNQSHLQENAFAKTEIISNYIETCPFPTHLQVFKVRNYDVKFEKFVDPYFELYDYLFNNIKDLKLNVNSLIQNILKEKSQVTRSDPLRSYLQTFIKDRTQILRRIKRIESSIEILAEKTRKINMVMFLEMKISRLENRANQMDLANEALSKEKRIQEEQFVKKLEKLSKDQNIFFSLLLSVLILISVGFVIYLRVLSSNISQDRRTAFDLTNNRFK